MSLDWQELSGDVTVEDIMTRRKDLLCLHFEEQEQRSKVLKIAKNRRYDIVPIEKDGKIIEILYIDDEERDPLEPSWLVSGDTTIPDLVEIFSSSGRPALLVLKGQKVGGLVTPADLNRIPARVFFYRLVAELEWGLAKLIRAHFHDDLEQVMEILPKTKREVVECRLSQLRESNFDKSVLEEMDLSHLLTIVGKCEALYSRLGYPSRRKFDDALSSIPTRLRHPTMHPVRALLTGESGGVEKIHAYVCSVREVLNNLEKAASSADAHAA